MNTKLDIVLKIFVHTLFTYITILLILAIAYLFSHNKQAILSTITRKQEPFTELYFENNEKLPIKVSYSSSLTYPSFLINKYAFSFTIHNLENKDKKYVYEVYGLVDKKLPIDNGEVFVKNGTTKTISKVFLMPDLHPKTEIVVNLVEKNQQIDFWMEDTINSLTQAQILKIKGL